MSEQRVVPAGVVSPTRVALVALGLVPVGMAAGGTAGVLGVAVWLGVVDGVQAMFDPAVWAVAAGIGGVLGGLLLPMVGLTALRHVPIGRLLGFTVLGSALGGLLGILLLGGNWLFGALAGFGFTTLRLWARGQRCSVTARSSGR
jgi:hypothetical protein